VVTATRTEKEILEVPTNITVITKEDIEKMKPMKITDVLRQLPGIFFTDTAASPHPSIRGTRTGATGGAYVMIDGIPIQMGKYGYTEWEGILPGDVERIEVVKGPVTSLYGGDAARGVINIITKKGMEKPSYKVSGRFGDYGDMRYSASTRGAAEKLDYALSVNRREHDGYRHGVDYEGTHFLGNVGYFIDDYSRLGLLLSLHDFERKNAAGLTKEQRDSDRRQSPYLNTQDFTDIISGLSYDRDTENHLVKLSFYYKDRDKEYHYNKPNTGSGDPDKYKYKDNMDEGIFGLKSLFGIKKNFLNRENTFILGFDMDMDKLKNRRGYLIQTSSNIKKMMKSSGDFEKDLYGFFLQDEFNIFKPMTLTVGIRYDLIRYDMDYKNDELDDKPDFDKANPRVGINYRFTDKNSAYFSYSNAYRAGTLYNHIGTATYCEEYDYQIKPENYTNYEVGYRHDFSSRLFLDLNLFYTQVKDEINYYYIDGRYAGSRNYGKTIHQGGEISIKGELLDRLSYCLAYAYLDTEVKKGKAKTIVLKGNEIVRSPHHTFTAMLDYQLLKRGEMNIDWHFDIRATSKYYQDMENTMKYPGYAVANTRLTFAYKGLEGFFGINNMFDKEYDGYAGKNVYYPASDRTYMGGFSFEF